MDTQKKASILRRLAAVVVLLFGTWSAGASILITNVAAVNITPGSFTIVASVVPALSPSTSVAISVFSDAAGKTNLAGQVGVEAYPLNSGDPSATNSYGAFLSVSDLRRDSMSLGLFYARVLECAPNSTYYYRITVTNTTNGQSAVWPSGGPLPSVATALENSFVLQSQQLLVTLNNTVPPGSVITLATSNSSSIIAAVVGDGTPTNQAFFNVNDLIAASGGTNYSPIGTEYFTATVQGSSSGGLSENYDLTFSTNFSVGQSNTVTLGSLPTGIGFGSTALLTGTSGSVPIKISALTAISNLSFQLNFPAGLFGSLSLQATSSALQSSSLTTLSPTSARLNFGIKSGVNLQTAQQVAQLNFTIVSNQSSAIVPLLAVSPHATNTDGSIVGGFVYGAGRLIVIGLQPILDTQYSSDSRDLVLYGIPGESYQIQSKTNLASPAWTDFLLTPMTNISLVISNLDPTPSSVFFRAYLLNAEPPRVQIAIPGKNGSLLVYGVKGSNYVLQSASEVSGTVVWHPLLSYTLTNSFQYIPNVGSSNSSIFYRIKRQ